MSDDPSAPRHVPVMLDRVVELLTPALGHEGAVIVDATLGLGGHAHAILDRCPQAVLVGIDRDPQALELAGRRLAEHRDRVRLVRSVYDRIGEVLTECGLPAASAILLDLGVSSLQLDVDDRGFAYRVDAPLDMRMDQSQGITAAEVLNTYPVDELARVLKDYGEERFARRIAAAVVREREVAPFTTSARLVELVRACVPTATRQHGGNPAKRTFQALRIEVNDELGALRRALPDAIDSLAVGGRLAVLSYHSLEDRMVKQAMAAGLHSSTPIGLPVELAERAPYLRALTRGGEEPDPDEIADNSRASSARLRAVERVRSTSGSTS